MYVNKSIKLMFICWMSLPLQIVIDYSEYVEEVDIERLKFLLSEMEAEMVMKSWDLSVTASIGNAEIQDYFTKGE